MDAFDFFRKKYGNNPTYQSWENHDQFIVALLTIPNCPDWAKPAVGIRDIGTTKELTLFLKAPDEGFANFIYGSMITVYDSFDMNHTLWFSCNNSIGGVSKVFIFADKPEDNVLDNLCLSFIQKINEMNQSGLYDTSRKKKVVDQQA